MNPSMLDILRTEAEHIREEGIRLIQESTGMHPVNEPGDSVVVFSPTGFHFWNKLSPAGKQIQAQLLPETERFSNLVRVMTRNLPSSVQGRLSGFLETIRDSIEQETTTWWKTKDEAVDGFQNLLKELVTTLEEYSAGSRGEVLAIVDTNALLANPDIEHWQFENTKHFTVILTPTILSELDRHKIDHKNPAIREKASSLIRKFKEYSRRGPLFKGISVVNGKVSLRSIATEPNMGQSLSWFDLGNADDRLLASAIEIMRDNLAAESFVVTADINLQNKAEMASIPFREVPVPPPSAKAECVEPV